MKFFSGFGFQNEAPLFEELLNKSEYSVAGFSLGAIDAFEYTCESQQRIDTLQLISPAFFQNRDLKFKRLQKRGYKKDPDSYLQTFYTNVCSDSTLEIDQYKADTNFETLEKLLDFTWDSDKLRKLVERGVRLEIHLGADDRIIDAMEAHEFFRQFGTSWTYKACGHLLQ